MLGEIRNQSGERLDYSLHPGEPGHSEVVVIGHGVTANKDRPFLVALADGFAARGIAALRMSFAGNGDSEGDFAAATITKEFGDLDSVLDALGARPIGYVGHSMGGAVGVLRAACDPRIRVLVSLAGMVHTAAFAQRKFGDLTPGRDCMWDKPECPLSAAFMQDMAALDSVAQRGADITMPWLLIHGSSDTVVPLQDARDIVDCAGDNAELVTLPDADHVFSGDATAAMVERVVPWVRDRLRG